MITEENHRVHVVVVVLLFVLAAALYSSAHADASPPAPVSTATMRATVSMAPTVSISQDIMQVFGPAYGPGAVRVATCESQLYPLAHNSTTPVWVNGQAEWASGLFQFIPTTWVETPYAGYSVYNAWANVRGAMWLFSRDGNDWRKDWPDTAHCAG